MKMRDQTLHRALAALLSAFTITAPFAQAKDLSSDDIRAIAKDAYIFGYPMVDSYRIQHAYFVDRGNPEFKNSYNQLRNIPRVFTPEDKAVQTPNSDTPYSFLGLDLRAEPVVITLPAIENERYFSVQFIDSYTHNFAYLGSRATGHGGGSYLLAGPSSKTTYLDSFQNSLHEISPYYDSHSPDDRPRSDSHHKLPQRRARYD